MCELHFVHRWACQATIHNNMESVEFKTSINAMGGKKQKPKQPNRLTYYGIFVAGALYSENMNNQWKRTVSDRQRKRASGRGREWQREGERESRRKRLNEYRIQPYSDRQTQTLIAIVVITFSLRVKNQLSTLVIGNFKL